MLLRPALVVALLGAGLLVAPSHAAPPDPVHGPLAGVVDPMLDLEAKMSDHLVQDIVVPVSFRDASQTPGTVVGTGSWGDSGLWSGVYLGGEAMRYATAKHYLHGPLPKDQRDFWTAQRDQAVERVRAVLRSEHRDINIAASWTGSLKVPPAVNTSDPTDKHAADFGGGVVHGEAGMMQRACTLKGSSPLGVSPPYQDPSNPAMDNSNRVFEITWQKSDGGDGNTYWCETSPSRDTYAGVTFGMLNAFDLVSADFPEMRAQIATDVLALGNFLLKYGWSYPRPHGYVSANHDFDGFLSPLFVYTPLARLNVANTVRHVADVAGSPADKQKWDAVWAEELATQGSVLPVSNPVGLQQPNEGYYGMNLNHLNTFDLLRTTDGVARDMVMRGFAPIDHTTRDDVNAHFEAIVYAVSGDRARLDLAVQHLLQWLDYRAAVSGGKPVDNASRCNHDLECVQQDQYEVQVDQLGTGPVTWFPGQPELPPVSSAQGQRARRPLPVGQRPPTDFLWQRSPCDLNGWQPATWREPGIDFLTPYWMIRYFTEVAPPAVTPIPTDPGPSYS
jgi:hypothetical protein